MKTSRHLVYAESRDTDGQAIIEGPFTAAQHRAFEAFVDHRVYWAERHIQSGMTTDRSPGVNEENIRRDVEAELRRMTFVIDGKMYGTGEEVGHFCPGYYDCLRCYPD